MSPSPEASATGTNLRRWALAAVAVLVLVTAVWIAGPALQPAPGPATEFTMVCVATGEVFTRSVEEAAVIPAKNPKTGAYTLLPCRRRDDGAVQVDDFYRGALTDALAEVNRVVDPQTLLVKEHP